MDRGRTEEADNGGREKAASRVRAGSLPYPQSGIRLPLRPSNIFSEVEEQEVTVLVSELEALSEEEVKVETRRRLFMLRRWINHPFTHLRVSAEKVLVDAIFCII